MPNGTQVDVVHTTIKLYAPDYILDWANQFYLVKKAEGVSPFTLTFYKQQLGHFIRFCEYQAISDVQDLTAGHIRQFMLWHEETGHNAGGLHAAFRVLRTFLFWYENEVEPEGWKNPIHKVKAPRLSVEPLDPVQKSDVKDLVSTCKGISFLDLRDKALLQFLLDTGARAREVISLNVDDLDQMSGEILIRHGKGSKPRFVFLGKASRKAMRAYLKARKDNSGGALWVTDEGERLTYSGLRAILNRRSGQAGIEKPSLHSFRRSFALEMLRNGTDVFTLQRLMGHADLKVMRRYLAQSDNDIREAHMKASPVDNW